MTLALEGVRVIDLTRILPGPFGSMMLADMGAEVIKVEETEERSELGRDILTPPSASREEEEKAAAYNFLGRNKKSLALDLKGSEAKDIFYKLTETADVIFESYRPGIAARLGVDYETLSEINPRIVYCSISGYGQDGPYSHMPGHDPNYASIAGLVGLNVDSEGKPMVLGAQVGDIGVALHAVIGILCALMARQKTGKGQYVDISFTDSAMDFGAMPIGLNWGPGIDLSLLGPPTAVNVFETNDGKFLSTGNIESYFWERFCKELGREDLIPHLHAKGEAQQKAISGIREVIRTKTRDEWFQIMKDANVCVTPVLELDELADDPQLRHREMVLDVEHPTAGKAKQLGMSIKLSDTPGQFRSFAPFLGQHTPEIMEEMGYSMEQIADLTEKGIIK
jgi:crotonobetainyl-CoA:carnitine CoA-transferase CaiB-like acyl-CoA transferase